MSTMDVVQVIGVISTIIISIIALFQSSKSKQIADFANGLSKEANILSLKAIWDTQKDYMPVIRLVDKFEIKKKNIFELSNEITFDFFNTINHVLSSSDGDPCCLEDEFNCICIELENIGKGISTGISINGLDIILGDKNLYDYNLENGKDDIDQLCHLTAESENLFIMNSGDKAKINLLISQDHAESNQLKKNEWSKRDSEIETYKDKIEYLEVTITMSLFIGSLNNNRAEYSETDLTGMYVDRKITNCSFSKYEKIN